MNDTRTRRPRIVLVCAKYAAVAASFYAASNLYRLSRYQPQEVTATAARMSSNPGITVTPEKLNLGRLLPGTTVTATFRVENNTSDELHICDIATSCGCARPRISNAIALPGETVELLVDLDAPSKPATILRSLSLCYTLGDNNRHWIGLDLNGVVDTSLPQDNN